MQLCDVYKAGICIIPVGGVSRFLPCERTGQAKEQRINYNYPFHTFLNKMHQGNIFYKAILHFYCDCKG